MIKQIIQRYLNPNKTANKTQIKIFAIKSLFLVLFFVSFDKRKINDIAVKIKKGTPKDSTKNSFLSWASYNCFSYLFSFSGVK